MRVFGIDGEAIDPDGNDDAPAIDCERRARNAPWDRIEIGADPRRAIDLFACAECSVQRDRAAQLPGAKRTGQAIVDAEGAGYQPVVALEDQLDAAVATAAVQRAPQLHAGHISRDQKRAFDLRKLQVP